MIKPKINATNDQNTRGFLYSRRCCIMKPACIWSAYYFKQFLSDIYTNEKLNVGNFRNFESRDTGLSLTQSEPTKDGT